MFCFNQPRNWRSTVQAPVPGPQSQDKTRKHSQLKNQASWEDFGLITTPDTSLRVLKTVTKTRKNQSILKSWLMKRSTTEYRKLQMFGDNKNIAIQINIFLQNTFLCRQVDDILSIQIHLPAKCDVNRFRIIMKIWSKSVYI